MNSKIIKFQESNKIYLDKKHVLYLYNLLFDLSKLILLLQIYEQEAKLLLQSEKYQVKYRLDNKYILVELIKIKMTKQYFQMLGPYLSKPEDTNSPSVIPKKYKLKNNKNNGVPRFKIDIPKRGEVNNIAGTKPIKVLIKAVKTNEIIISLILMGATNRLVKFLLHISSKNNMLKLMLDLNKKS